MSPAASRAVRKGIRSLLQAIGGGGLTALVAVVAGGLSPGQAALLTGAFTAIVAVVHNYLETAGTIPVLLPTPGLLTAEPSTAITTKVVGTLDATSATIGGVVTDVVDTAGKVIGGVVGTIDSKPPGS